MTGGFGDVDPGWADWEGDNRGWFDNGLDAVWECCDERRRFTTVDVWRRWRGAPPLGKHGKVERRRIAEVMNEAIRLGWCVRRETTGGHTRYAGHAGFGSTYEPVTAPVGRGR